MRTWLKAAIDYADQWLECQMRLTRQPGCVFAVAHKGRLVFEKAYGHANVLEGERMTPRHRFRVASHSKSFTAAAILKLREAGELGLDDPVGRYVDGLHASLAPVTLMQLLSHGAGVIRDGADAGQWIDERPFADEADLRVALSEPPLIPPGTRMKYSNHGFGLLGMVIERVAGEPYGDWITRNILVPLKLDETRPDAPFDAGTPVARGHSAEVPLGHRVIIPGDNPTNALAPATGFISTAADLVRFFASLDPSATQGLLSPASRRAMLQRQWRDPHATAEGYYGLGLCLGVADGWEWAGHGGGFQSAKTFTAMLPGSGICFSVLTNAIDGMGEIWSDGVIKILKTFATSEPPTGRARAWTGRWWSLGAVVDLVPFNDRVLVATPSLLDPFAAANEITITARDRGVISLSGGYGRHGEPARLVRDRNRTVREVWLGGSRLVPEHRIKTEMKRKYE
ncbi:MAG: beta-lactamase family protein [Alphaproteobacteria bacterium]|nr:beta-lactamase family protein [Alphaproteobacteria bacterium]